MVLNLISAALVLLIAYMWSIRGFFSAFLHMVAVIVAGAFAFGFWEMTSIWLLNMSPDKGILSSIGGNAWAIGLIVPFLVSLVIIRVIFDKMLIANVAQTTLANYIGGGVCGVVTGILSVGILVIALGAVRFGDSTMGMGYRPIYYTEDRAAGGGSLVKDDTLWIPSDKITSKFYSHLSNAAFFAPEPLAKWHPAPYLEGPTARLSYGEGDARNTIKPKDLTFKGMYTVGGNDQTPVNQLLTYAGGTQPQKYTDTDGETVSTGQLVGVKFELGPAAKESTAQHMISPGQIRMIAEPVDASGAPTGEPSHDIFPIALISQGDGASAESYGRWRFEAEGVHISSVGGGASAAMAAEFVVPTGNRPIAIYVKGVRLELDATAVSEATKFATTGMRDAQVSAGTILKAAKAENLDRSMSFTYPAANIGTRGGSEMLVISTRLGREAFPSSAKRGLQLNEDKEIESGSGTWTPAEVGRGRDISAALKVDRFSAPAGTAMFQLNVSPTMQASLLGQVGSVADPSDAFYLIDSQGTLYQAVGYVYKDRERYDIVYNPGQPLNGMADIKTPGLTSVRDDQSLKLLFLVSLKVELEAYSIGDKVVFQLDEPFEVTTR